MQSSAVTASSPSTPRRRLDETRVSTPWLVCFVAAAYFFYEFIQMNMFNAISADLMRAFHITGVNLSKMSSAYFYADVLFLFPAGIILDRVSTRKLILVALGICVVSTLLFASAHALWFAIACHFAAGIGNAFCLLSCILLASRWFPPRQLALVTGLIVTFAMAGGAVAQTPLAILAEHVGWRTALALNGILGAAIWLLNWLFVYDRPLDPARDYSRNFHTQHIDKLPFFQSIRLALGNYQNWLAGIYTSLTNLPLMVLGGLWGSLFLQQIHGFTAENAATIFLMLFVGTIIGSPVFGYISDNMRRRRLPMLVGAAIALVFAWMMVEVNHFSFWGAAIIFFAIGFFTSSQVISYPLITESNPRVITGTSLGIASLLIMGGAGVAQQVFGHIIDHYWDKTLINGVPQYSAIAYHHALLIFPITLLISLVCAAFVKETYCENVKQ
jgi:MFS family permease